MTPVWKKDTKRAQKPILPNRSIWICCSIQIQNIMHNHNFVKKHYATIDIPIPKQENLNHINEQLMLQFNRIVNENISNVDMDVNFIAQANGNEPCVTLQQD